MGKGMAMGTKEPRMLTSKLRIHQQRMHLSPWHCEEKRRTEEKEKEKKTVAFQSLQHFLLH